MLVVTAKDLILVLIGAIAGAAMSSWYSSVATSLRRTLNARRLQRRAVEDRRGVMWRRLLEYYGRRGRIDQLYQPVNISTDSRIPLLVDQSWLVSLNVDRFVDQIVYIEGSTQDRFKVDHKLIRRREAQGARIFDGEILYLKSFEEVRDEGFRLTARRCNFFSYATLALRLERELRTRLRKTRILDNHFSDAFAAVTAPAEPLAIGCSCVTVFCAGDRLYVPIQSRSAHVMNLSNMLAVVPTFALEANTIGQRRSRRGLIYYNYAREFAEELFDLEEVIDVTTARRADPDWIFGLPELELLEREFEANRFSIEVAGISVNPLHGIVNVALLAVATSEPFFDIVREATKANWEAIDRPGAELPIEFVDLADSKIDDWVDQARLGATSSFALDRARQRISQGDPRFIQRKDRI